MLTLFEDIKGQEKAKHLLATAIKNARTSHAYLFKGPTGVGKKMMAHALCALVNCLNPQQTTICGTCSACKKLKSGNHPDFNSIEASGVGIKISQIRELQKQLAFPPFEAKTRVILIPDIHSTMRRPEVANALLKTLEEPPENTLIILTGDEAGMILPTIISRCQIIPFTPLPLADVAALIENEGISHRQAMTLAAIAEGSPGRAKHHQHQGLLDLRKTIIHTLTHTEKNHHQAVEKIYTIAQQGSELKDDAGELLDLLTSWLRDLILLNRTESPPNTIINQDLDDLDQSAQLWTPISLLTCVDAIATARQQLLRNCNRTLVFEVLFFALLDEKC